MFKWQFELFTGGMICTPADGWSRSGKNLLVLAGGQRHVISLGLTWDENAQPQPHQMTVKPIFPLTSLLTCILLLSCSRNPELATSALPKDFDGLWSGAWNWGTNLTTFVQISGKQIKVTTFPMETAPNDKMVFVSTEGEARFQNEYGSSGAPCVLLFFNEPRDVVPLFISKDKQHLVYDVNIIRDQRIVFKRTAEAKDRVGISNHEMN